MSQSHSFQLLQFRSFSPCYDHIRLLISLLDKLNRSHYLCLNVLAVTLRDLFHCVSHFQLSTLYITITAIWKLILSPSAGTGSDQVWIVLLAVSVSQFGLSAGPVWHLQPSNARKAAPNNSALCTDTNTIQGMQLREANFFLVASESN